MRANTGLGHRPNVPIGPQRLLAIASRSSTARGGTSAHIDGSGAKADPERETRSAVV